MNARLQKIVRSDHQAGFTLLEVVLTLAMSVALMVLIGGAIRFYGRDMDLRNLDVRQTQLAAAILQMIENDLRSAVHSDPVDTAPLADLLASIGGGEFPEEDLSAAGIDDPRGSDRSPEVSPDASLSLQEDTSLLQTPGLIGDANQIQIDLSHLPRLEEYTQWIDENTADYDDVPSDLKTVAYFVQAEGTSYGVEDSLGSVNQSTDDSSLPNVTNGNGGLVRRSLDRSASTYASATGGVSRLSQTGELIAPEVIAIGFAYWDGMTWLTAWSSDEYGELPLAVRVQLTMRDLTAGDSDATRTFSHTVGLLMARVVDETESDDGVSSTETAL